MHATCPAQQDGTPLVRHVVSAPARVRHGRGSQLQKILEMQQPQSQGGVRKTLSVRTGYTDVCMYIVYSCIFINIYIYISTCSTRSFLAVVLNRHFGHGASCVCKTRRVSSCLLITTVLVPERFVHMPSQTLCTETWSRLFLIPTWSKNNCKHAEISQNINKLVSHGL